MINIEYTVQLDLTDNGCFNTGWRLKQGDSGILITVKIVNNGEAYFDASIVPEIVFKRADGKAVVSNMIAAEGFYNYAIVGNELAIAGPVVMDVKIKDNEERKSTVSCKFTCVEDPYGYDPEGTSTYNNPVAELVAEAKAIAEDIGDISGLKKDVTELNQSFTQLYADGYASRNLIQDISQGSWEDDGKKSTNQTSNVKRCLVENKIACVKGKSFTFSDEDNNYQIYARIFDASGTRVESIGWTNTVTPTNNNSSYTLVTIRKKDDSNFTPSDIKNAQIEYGTQATAFTEYAMPNTELTKLYNDNDGWVRGKNRIPYYPIPIYSYGHYKVWNDERGFFLPKGTYAFTSDYDGYLQLFNSSKTWVSATSDLINSTDLSKISFASGMAILKNNCVFTTNTDYYVTLSSPNYESTNAMLVDGDIPMAYQPYVPSNAELNKSLTQISAFSGIQTLSGASYVHYWKRGDIITVTSELDNIALTKNAWTQIGILPEGYRPPRTLQCNATFGSGLKGIGAVQIRNDGVVRYFTSHADSDAGIVFSVTY